jgi:hypothetical protein
MAVTDLRSNEVFRSSGAHLPVTDFMALHELQPPCNQQATAQTVFVKETALGPEIALFAQRQ